MDKKRLLPILMLCFLLPKIYTQGKIDHNININTNAAYLLLSAISTNSNNLFIILPLESQIALQSNFSINPSVIALIFGKPSNNYTGSMLLTECGIAYQPKGFGISGWRIGIGTGIAYALDNNKIGLSFSGELGYQWEFQNRFICGVSGGFRDVIMEGNLIIPDLRIRIGLAL